MYIERNEFQLKFGAGKEAVSMWKKYLGQVQADDNTIHARLLTDISGSLYTLILEIRYETFAEAEPSQCKLVNRNDWKEFYKEFIPLCERSTRTYYKLQVDF